MAGPTPAAARGPQRVCEPLESDGPFRMHYGVLAILVGWFVTFLTFCVVFAFWMGISAWMANTRMEPDALSFLVIVVIYGFLPALFIGLPLGALTGWPLRRIRNQWWHVLIHAAVTGAVPLAFALMIGGSDGLYGMLLFPAVAAFSAAVGRASVIRMVAVRNAG